VRLGQGSKKVWFIIIRMEKDAVEERPALKGGGGGKSRNRRLVGPQNTLRSSRWEAKDGLE